MRRRPILLHHLLLPSVDPAGAVTDPGQGPTGGPAPVPAPPAAPPPGYLTQEQVNAIAARERQDGARKLLREKYGVEKLEDLDALVQRARAAEEAQLTEAQKQAREAAAARAAADAERAAAAQERLALRLERAAMGAGAVATAQDVAVLLTTREGITGDSTDAEVTAALQRLAERTPGLFAAATAPPAQQPAPPVAPGSVPGRPPGATPPNAPGAFGQAGLEEARRRGWVKDPGK